jgi:hypothetical protein
VKGVAQSERSVTMADSRIIMVVVVANTMSQVL